MSKEWEKLAKENFKKEDEGLAPCELQDKYGFDFCSYCYCDTEVCGYDCPCEACFSYHVSNCDCDNCIERRDKI